MGVQSQLPTQGVPAPEVKLKVTFHLHCQRSSLCSAIHPLKWGLITSLSSRMLEWWISQTLHISQGASKAHSTAGCPHSLCTICKLIKQNMSCTRSHKVLTPYLPLRHFSLYSPLCHCVCREISVPEVIILSKPRWPQPRYPRVEKGYQQSSQESSGGGKLCA